MSARCSSRTWRSQGLSSRCRRALAMSMPETSRAMAPGRMSSTLQLLVTTDVLKGDAVRMSSQAEPREPQGSSLHEPGPAAVRRSSDGELAEHITVISRSHHGRRAAAVRREQIQRARLRRNRYQQDCTRPGFEPQTNAVTPAANGLSTSRASSQALLARLEALRLAGESPRRASPDKASCADQPSSRSTALPSRL